MSKRNAQTRDVSASALKEAELMQNKKPTAEVKTVPVAPTAPVQEVEPVAAPEEAEPKVDFDAWFAMRRAKIPAHHHKEIIKADFKRRNLGQCESLKDFDAALKKYGLNLA